MARVTPPDRLPKLLDAAAATFVEHGFQRAQMDDVAERLGVSKGTIYRAVESKEALFAAVIAWADDPDSIPESGGLAPPGDLAAVAGAVVAELGTAIAALELTAAVAARRRPRSAAVVAEELERITVGLYRTMRSRRTAIMVLDRCAAEIPELSSIWFGEGRYALVDLWADYLKLRVTAIGTDVDRAILARTVVEIITIWAVKMPWDRAPRPYPDDTAAACGTLIRHLVMGGTR
jgi:AcrR family transcriptional regulator